MAAERAPKDLIPKDFGKLVAEGIKQAIGKENVLPFSRRAGIHNSTLRSILEGSIPGADKLVRISWASGKTIDALLAQAAPRLKEPDVDYGGGEFVHVPRLSLGEIQSEQIVDILAFNRSFILGLGIAPDQAAVVLVAGDAMAPTLSPGDAVLIDRGSTGVQRLRPGRKPHIYVYSGADQGRLAVGRLHVADGAEKRWCIVRDNDAHESTLVNPKDIRVIGRARWVGGVLEE